MEKMFLIFTLLNFVIATGMMLMVYYKWFKSDEIKDDKIRRLKDSFNHLINESAMREKEIEAFKQSFIDDLLEFQDENIKLKNLLSKFERNRDQKTGRFIKSKDE